MPLLLHFRHGNFTAIFKRSPDHAPPNKRARPHQEPHSNITHAVSLSTLQQVVPTAHLLPCWNEASILCVILHRNRRKHRCQEAVCAHDGPIQRRSVCKCVVVAETDIRSTGDTIERASIGWCEAGVGAAAGAGVDVTGVKGSTCSPCKETCRGSMLRYRGSLKLHCAARSALNL